MSVNSTKYSTKLGTYSSGAVITHTLFNTEFNAIANAFHASTGHNHDGTTAGAGAPITTLYGNAISIGTNADTDIALTFNANSNDGVLTWMEDEDYFKFSDDVLIDGTEKLQFRDTALYINSSTDGQLDIVADTEIQIAATTVDINANVSISGSIADATTITASGEIEGGSLDINGAASIAGAVTDVTTLTASGEIEGGSLDINGAASIAGAITDVTTLTASGEIEGGSLDINGAASIAGAITDVTTLTASGEIEGGSLDINGAASIAGAITDVTTLTASGEIEGGSLDINGVADIAGALTVNADFLEVISTDTGATDMPILSLFRNSSSPAHDDHIGGLRFYGENDAGEKSFYAGIHASILDDADSNNKGGLEFTIGSGVGGNSPTVTDVTAAPVNTQTPFRINTDEGVVIQDANLSLISLDSLANEEPVIELWRKSGSGLHTPSDNDELGSIKFFASDDTANPPSTTATKTLYAEIYAEIADTTDGTEDGRVKIDLIKAGTNTETVTIDSTLTTFATPVTVTGAVTASSLDISGTSTLSNNLTLNANLFEMTSTTNDATEKPVISLYRDAGVPTANDEIGSLRFFGQNASDEKVFYGGMYVEMNDITDNAHKGAIKFHTADGSGGGTAVSDVTADISGDEDATFIITSDTATLNADLSVNGTTIELTDTTTGSTTENPSIELYRNGGAGADAHELGAIKFYGNNDAGSPEKIEYAKIYSEIIDASDGTEDGSLKFHLLSNGSSEDPVMTLQQFGLIMGSGNSIYLGANGTLSFEGTTDNSNETSIVATNPTTDRTITLPDATGTVITSGNLSDITTVGTLAQDTLEVVSTDTGAGEKPNLSLYRNSSSPAASDELGSIDFYGENDADQKHLYAQIYAEATLVADGGEQGHMNFSVCKASTGGGMEDPTMRLRHYALEILANNDLILGQNSNIQFEGSANDSYETTFDVVNPTADRTVSLPDADGTLAHIASNGGLQHPTLSSAPSSPANGQTYYNTSTHKLQLYANGGWVDLN